jgi:hypothetical protein
MSAPKNSIIRVKKTSNLEIEVFPGYSKEECLYNEINVDCWNCTHSFNIRDLKHIPLKYISGSFYITGYFCTNGCCLRYIYDNYQNKELWDKYELFNFYYQKLYNLNLNIVIPPNKLLLKKFGGTLEIEDYRSNDSFNEVIIPPVIMVSSKLFSEKTESIKENKQNLKLFRKNTKKNTILNNMEIE